MYRFTWVISIKTESKINLQYTAWMELSFLLNSLPNNIVADWLKLTAFADINLNLLKT